MLALNFPGQMSYDSVAQLADGRSGFYNTWHPPLMAFLLGLGDALLPGTGLFLLLQALLMLGGFLMLLACNPRPGWWTALIAAVIVTTPQWLLFQGEIWKDILFSAAAIAGFGALALVERRWHHGWIALAALCFTVAAATRQTGLILLPVAGRSVALIALRNGFSRRRWGGGFLAATLILSLAITAGLTLRGDRGDGAAAQARIGQAYDIAGAYARDPGLALPLASRAPALYKALRTTGAALYTPLRIDPLVADPDIAAALNAAPPGALGQGWRALILTHPLLYARLRAAVFAAVLTTPDSLVCHFAPVGISGDPVQMQALGLSPRIRPQDAWLAGWARHFFATPVYSHLFWGAGALILLLWFWRGGQIAVTGLLTAALVYTLTFAVLSAACDYRYLVFLDLAVMASALTLARRDTA